MTSCPPKRVPFGLIFPRWALCCTSDVGLLAGLLRKSNDASVHALARAVAEVLRSRPEFHDVRWYRDWRGREDEPWFDAP